MPIKEELRAKTVCFTGHRHIPENELPIIKERLRETVIELIERGYRFFGAGGALGFDTLAALTVLELRAAYPQIRLILVLPCKDQTLKWSCEDVLVYNGILRQADKVVYLHERYTDGCMHERNRYLVDNSSVCVCYLRRESSGTAYTVTYAGKCGCDTVDI